MYVHAHVQTLSNRMWTYVRMQACTYVNVYKCVSMYTTYVLRVQKGLVLEHVVLATRQLSRILILRRSLPQGV